MNKERKLTFGKYKGQDIKYIILTHIGYIMWCFENISRFKLTDEEQIIDFVVNCSDDVKPYIIGQLETLTEYLKD